MQRVGIVGAGGAAARKAIEREAERRGWDLTWAKADDEGHPALPDGSGVLLVRRIADVAPGDLGKARELLREAAAAGWTVVVVELAEDLEEIERRLQRAGGGESGGRQERARGRRSNVPPAVVSRIRKRRADGASYGLIAEELNADAVPTSQGGKCWYPSTVRAIMSRH